MRSSALQLGVRNFSGCSCIDRGILPTSEFSDISCVCLVLADLEELHSHPVCIHVRCSGSRNLVVNLVAPPCRSTEPPNRQSCATKRKRQRVRESVGTKCFHVESSVFRVPCWMFLLSRSSLLCLLCLLWPFFSPISAFRISPFSISSPCASCGHPSLQFQLSAFQNFRFSVFSPRPMIQRPEPNAVKDASTSHE